MLHAINVLHPCRKGIWGQGLGTAARVCQVFIMPDAAIHEHHPDAIESPADLAKRLFPNNKTVIVAFSSLNIWLGKLSVANPRYRKKFSIMSFDLLPTTNNQPLERTTAALIIQSKRAVHDTRAAVERLGKIISESKTLYAQTQTIIQERRLIK